MLILCFLMAFLHFFSKLYWQLLSLISWQEGSQLWVHYFLSSPWSIKALEHIFNQQEIPRDLPCKYLACLPNEDLGLQLYCYFKTPLAFLRIYLSVSAPSLVCTCSLVTVLEDIRNRKSPSGGTMTILRGTAHVKSLCSSPCSSDSGLHRLLGLSTAVLCSPKAGLCPHLAEQYAWISSSSLFHPKTLLTMLCIAWNRMPEQNGCGNS